MDTLHHYVGLVGCMMLLIAFPLTLLRAPRFRQGVVLVVFFAMSVLVVISIKGLIFAAYIRAVTGDLSITSIILLGYFIAEAYTGNKYIDRHDRRLIQAGVLVLAILLYPFALGLGYWDSYAGGYGSWWLYALVLILSGLLWQMQAWFPLVLLLLDISGYLTGLLESDNLWDYLIDPWLVMAMVLTGIVNVAASFNLKAWLQARK